MVQRLSAISTVASLHVYVIAPVEPPLLVVSEDKSNKLEASSKVMVLSSIVNVGLVQEEPEDSL